MRERVPKKTLWNLNNVTRVIADNHNHLPRIGKIMLHWAITFLVIALIAAVFGFTGIVSVSIQIAQILFFVFLVLFIITAVMHILQGKKPPL
jgi:uncharacterized membrane protein YtjA (UPF0391 family)